MADQSTGSKMSRRKFIRNSSYVAGGLVGGGLLGGLIGSRMNGSEQASSSNSEGHSSSNSHQQAPLYFTNPQKFEVLQQAVERIYPKDETGPGAIELGVPFFIDHQLAGAWGNNAREYMQGPFFPGSNFQGYQSPLKRNEMFDTGIDRIESYSQEKFTKGFADLEGDQQDEILKDFEADKVKIRGVSSKTFFNQLRAATIEGVYADPAYSGNIGMEGWKMKDFPGHQMSYIDKIESDEFMEIEPKALHSYTN